MSPIVFLLVLLTVTGSMSYCLGTFLRAASVASKMWFTISSPAFRCLAMYLRSGLSDLRSRAVALRSTSFCFFVSFFIGAPRNKIVIFHVVPVETVVGVVVQMVFNFTTLHALRFVRHVYSIRDQLTSGKLTSRMRLHAITQYPSISVRASSFGSY